MIVEKPENHFFKSLQPRWVWAVLTVVLSLIGCRFQEGIEDSQWCEIPGGETRLGSPEGGDGALPRALSLEGFFLGRYEVTVEDFAEYASRVDLGLPEHHQLARKGKEFVAKPGEGKKPVTSITHAQAQDYCRWLSGEKGRPIRLPTEDEWEVAARGGLQHGRYPWGWGTPVGRACFDAENPVPVGSFKPNPLGVQDMAGNVAEWCTPVEPVRPEALPARGGSWAEHDPNMLRVFQRAWFREDYADTDVGFRLLMESP